MLTRDRRIGQKMARSDSEQRRIDGQVEIFQRKKAKQKEEIAARARSIVIGSLEASFRHTKNPIFVWGAWRFCRSTGIEVPEWVSANFDIYANAIMGIVARPPKEKVGAKVAAAIGFPGGKNGDNPFVALRQLAESERYMEIFLLAIQSGKSDSAAINIVEKHLGVPRSTVRRHLDDRCNIFGISLKDLRMHLGDPAWGERLAIIGQRLPVMLAEEALFQDAAEL